MYGVLQNAARPSYVATACVRAKRLPCSEEVCGVGGKGEVVRNTWGVGGVLGGKQPREVFRGLEGARRQRHGAALRVLSISAYDAMCVLSIYLCYV